MALFSEKIPVYLFVILDHRSATARFDSDLSKVSSNCGKLAVFPSPPLRGRWPRSGQRGVQIIPKPPPLTAKQPVHPPLSLRDTSPSRGEIGVYPAIRSTQNLAEQTL